jgi:biopolymer transport protein ExbD
MRYREKSDYSQALDIAPINLIDILIILLIFFMVTTTFNKDMKLDLNRPSASSATTVSSKTLRLYIDRLGATYLDGEPIRIWLIQSKLRDLLRASDDKTILVVTDQTVPAGKLVEVIDQARLAGAKEVGVATEKEAG